MAIKSKTPGKGASWLRSLLASLMLTGAACAMNVAHAGYAAIVINEADGQVITAVNVDDPNHPASLAKMMTLYLTFQALESGKLKLDQELPVSAWAASRAPTKLDLRKGQTVSVEDCVLGMITKSANDAATVVAESLGENEGHFVELMNAQALKLGMKNTHFANASGLPDPNDTTTARDMSKLAMALYHDYPQYSHYFSTKQFMFRGRLVRGHNNLMDKYPGMDGLKTGFTNASGFNLASTAVRDGQRLFSVVMGGHTAGTRDRLMARLLDDGFEDRETPAMLVAQAGGASTKPGAASKILHALSPISTAEAETAPVSRRHHRRGQVGAVASAGCTPRKGSKCPASAAPKRSTTKAAASPTKTASATKTGGATKTAGAAKSGAATKTASTAKAASGTKKGGTTKVASSTKVTHSATPKQP